MRRSFKDPMKEVSKRDNVEKASNSGKKFASNSSVQEGARIPVGREYVGHLFWSHVGIGDLQQIEENYLCIVKNGGW